MKLLIAEDDPKLLKSLIHIFKANKYAVDGVSNGRDALEFAESGDYDGLILDIMMPEMDGLEVLKRLREEGITVPTLFLTARTQIEQRVEGLDVGADDYISKPFAPMELLARVRAMLRRMDNYVPDLLEYCGVVLNRSNYEISYDEKVQILSGKEYQIMEILMIKPRNIITTEHFMTRIWGWDTMVDTSVVWVHVSNLRKKLAAIAAPVEIRFMRGAGYMLEEKV